MQWNHGFQLEVGTKNTSFVAIVPVFDATVEVQAEQEAYPILSFVADIGGILGWFIGFNFLAVWDGFMKFIFYFLNLTTQKSNVLKNHIIKR